ncbi:hypothetical protein [Psychroflexus aestuariivivens]|uniref:hypothetical protein n=1 Tax=Psychroflexus aestuariivivens TaxID=1795040 RepID=UPI000FD91F72|nr:hypothetical protein [Psychroflexus aestuariivivens]
MSLPKSISEAIENYPNETGLWREIILQLNKDLALAGISEIELKIDTSPNELVEGLHQIFSNLMHDKTSNFIQLLYRIDIQEEDLKQMMLDSDFMEKLIYKILERSFQKVYWRKKLG